MPATTLRPYDPAHRAALLALAVRPDQVPFSGQPADVIDDPAPHIDMHLIVHGAAVAGMFRINRAYHTDHLFASRNTLGLRTFLIDHALQGHGIASAACLQLRSYLAPLYPTFEAVFLTVNLRNPAARAVYLKGGFKDTQAQFMGGAAGPQHILKLPLHN